MSRASILVRVKRRAERMGVKWERGMVVVRAIGNVRGGERERDVERSVLRFIQHYKALSRCHGLVEDEDAELAAACRAGWIGLVLEREARCGAQGC